MKKLESINPMFGENLNSEGYVTLPCLGKDDIKLLIDLFNEFHPSLPEGFYASTHSIDKNSRKEISEQIAEVVRPKIVNLFSNLELLGGAFISKAPGTKGILPLHQDWNIVNEKEARSYNLWIPLVDVNEGNGAMRILKQSHLKQETYRGPNLYPTLSNISKLVDENMVSLNMMAGEALLYDHALWHSSPVNQSNQLRLAVVFGIIPKGVEMKFYHQNGNQIEEYNSYPSFFFENDLKDGPKGLELNRSFIFKQDMLNQSDFETIYLGQKSVSLTNEKKKRSLLQLIGLKK
jgi:hypothetical protein